MRHLFPDSDTYTDVYDRHRLLTSKVEFTVVDDVILFICVLIFNNFSILQTIMAHCIYLSQRELDILKDRGVGISHCASSNIA